MATYFFVGFLVFFIMLYLVFKILIGRPVCSPFITCDSPGISSHPHPRGKSCKDKGFHTIKVGMFVQGVSHSQINGKPSQVIMR